MAGSSVIANLIAKLGLDTSGFEEGSNSTNALMQKLGSVITKSMVKAQVAVKALSAGLDLVKKGASAAIGVFNNTVKSSKAAYASFEQLSDGAELMFGKAFDTVAKNAQDAWKTVQLSQNEYLQQANGFATGLKTSLGGDEQAAADLAHNIIKAEADVISATGNSREAVQNAFNGIMKSNYMMLDNLQLGINPTKEGFQELIDQVNAYNATQGKATNYQIDNLAQSQQALVDYIEMQGLAGYAANEAAGTIEGATASVNAAWQNVTVSLAGGGADIETAFENLGTAAQSWLLNVVPRIGHIMGGIGDALAKTIPSIGEKMTAVIPGIVPKFVAGGLKLAVGLVKGIGQGVKILWQLLGEIWQQLGQTLEGLGLKDLGKNIMESVLTGIKIGWNNVLAWFYEALGNLVTSLEAWLQDKLGKLADLPVIRDLFKDLRNVQVDLGGGDLQGKAADRKSQSQQLQKEQTKLIGDIKNGMQDFESGLMDRCSEILDKEDGIAGQVSQAGDDVVKAVNGSGTEGDGETAMDVLNGLLDQWDPGTYNKELAEKIQSVLNLITPDNDGIQIGNWEAIDDRVAFTKKYGSYLDKHSADEVYKQFQSDGIETKIQQVGTDVQSVQTEVANKDLSVENDISVDAPDMTGVEAAVTNVGTKIEGMELSPTISVDAPDMSGVQAGIEGIGTKIGEMELDPTINVAAPTIPPISVPEANVTVATDTSILDTSAANLNTSATGLTGSAANLDTSATNLDTSAASIAGLSTPDEVRQTFQGRTTSQNKWNTSGIKGLNLPEEQSVQETTVQPMTFQAIPDEVIESYNNMATAVSNLNLALSGGMAGEEGGEGMMAEAGAEGEAVLGIPEKFDAIGTSASNTQSLLSALSDYVTGTFIGTIQMLSDALAVVSIDEEGNMSAGAGNTLYTAMGVIYGLLGDIYNKTTDIENEWSGAFFVAVGQLKRASGDAQKTLEPLAADTKSVADNFAGLAKAIQDTAGALSDLAGTPGAGDTVEDAIEAAKNLGANYKKGGGKASGGPVAGGTTYLVGEEGPELFTPHRSGYIIPNDELTGGRGDSPIVVNFNGDVIGDEKNIMSLVRKAVKRGIREEVYAAS